MKNKSVPFLHNMSKGFNSWVKSPFGLLVLLISTLYQCISWPVYFYIENDYEKIDWIEVDVFEFSRPRGKYGGYRLRVKDREGDEYVFSNFGFEKSGVKKFYEILNKGDKIGWYSTCLPWKSVKVGSLFLSGNCAVIMEADRNGNRYVSFEERVDFLEQGYYFILIRVYWVYSISILFSMTILVFFLKRNFK